jgi:tetratricopeptide (TPR) repeat protein
MTGGAAPSRPPWWCFALLTALVTPLCFLGLPDTDSDVFYHLAGGRWMHEHHRLLDHETFSFTIAGRPWTNYYWAFERLLYGAYRLAGLGGVFALRGLLILATVNLFLLLVHRRTRGALLETVAFGLLVLPVYLLRALNVRPHLFSYLFLVIALLLADAFTRRRRGAGAALVLLCVLWANLHGVEYPVLLAVLLIHLADAARPHLGRHLAETLRDRGVRRWAALTLACALAFLVNPFGWRLFLTPRIGADAEVMAQIAEMAAPSLSSFGQLTPALDLASWFSLRLAALVGVALLPLLVRTGQVREAALFVLGLALLLNKSRFAVEFIMLAVPSVAAAVATFGRRHPARRWPRHALVAAAVYVAASAALTVRAKARAGAFAPVSATAFPVGAVRFIEQSGLSGNLHGEPTFAGYVTFALYPRVRVSMDMRAPEPFGAQELWLAWALGDTIPLERVEERWPIDLVLFRHTHRLAVRFRSHPGFAPVYADSEWLLLARVRAGAIASGVKPLSTLPFMEALAAGREVPPPPLTDLRAEAERLVGAWPANDLAQRALLGALLQEGRAEEAHTQAEDLARRYPRGATFPFYSGLALRRLGRPAEAADAFQRATVLDPTLVPARVALAEALLGAQKPQAAREAMEKVAWLRWPVLSAREYALLGRLRQHAGEWRPARDAFERALWLMSADDPLRPDVGNDLAVVSLAAGDPARALAALDEALARRPAFPQARLNRARALRQLGRPAESRAVLDHLAADPTLPAALRPVVDAELGR